MVLVVTTGWVMVGRGEVVVMFESVIIWEKLYEDAVTGLIVVLLLVSSCVFC